MIIAEKVAVRYGTKLCKLIAFLTGNIGGYRRQHQHKPTIQK